MIIKNAIITPDGTELHSTNRHDFKMHKDKITGKEYGVDGGNAYCRHIGDVDKDCKVILIEVDEDSMLDEFEALRKHFTWGSYGKGGTSPRKDIKLCDMSNEHIEAILETQYHISKIVRSIFEEELQYRKLHNIFIVD